MYKYEYDICEFCPETFQKAIALYCENISNSDADIFVLMAHKAVSLFKVLLEQKHISLTSISNKIIVSNQALYFNCDYFCGKKVTIIDDIVISGTSIASTVNQLLNIGVEQNDINIVVLAIDKKYFAMDFNKKNGSSALICDTILEDSNCIELSYYISNIFSLYGIPYNVDFPLYKADNFDGNITGSYNYNLIWDVIEIPNNHPNKQRNNNTTITTLFPRKCVRNLLWEKIGVNLEECVHLKIRLYKKKYPNGKNETFIMPICVFKGIKPIDLDDLFILFKPMSDIKVDSDDESVAKFHFVQFYIAHQLYMVFKSIVSFKADYESFKKSIFLLFGKIDSNKVLDSIDNPIDKELRINHNFELPQDYNSNFFTDFGSNNNWNSSFQDTQELNSCEINHRILTPFLWWYDTTEINIREELKKDPKNYVLDFNDIKSMPSRLNSGFSLPFLQNVLKETVPNYDSENAISAFLDKAIDEGVIVPTVYCNNERTHLCRIYRHGEDLPFSLADQCRLLYFLKVLGEQISDIVCPDKGIAPISMEKIIVLFYQIGLKRGGIFNRFLGFDNIKLLRPFLSVHGVIEGFIDTTEMKSKSIKEHFYSEKDDGDEYITWLTKWLSSNLFINFKNKSNKHIVCNINILKIDNFLKENERNCMSDTIKSEIWDIALMLSTWYNDMAKQNKKDQFKEDATIVTSCSDTYVFASAIATEIHYFSKYWQNQVKETIVRSCTFADINMELTSIYAKKSTTNIEQALNSGRKKIMWFEENQAASVVTKVESILKKIGMSSWVKLWTSIIDAQYIASSDLKNLIDQTIGFIYFFSSCYDCLKYEGFWTSGLKPQNYDRYKELYEIQCHKTDLLRKNIFVMLDEIIELTDFEQKKLAFNKLVLAEINDSDTTVQRIELEIESNSPTYTIEYKSALVFDIRSIDDAFTEMAIYEIWDQLDDADAKNQINIVRFPAVSLSQGFIRYGFFYYISSENDPIHCGEFLLEIYSTLLKKISGRIYEIRAIIFPDVPPGFRFKHNVEKNIHKYAREFENEVVDAFKKFYELDTKQQLIFALTPFVPDDLCNMIKNSCWDDTCCPNKLDAESNFDRIIICKNKHIMADISKKNISYSIVKIVGGSKWGTGFLVKTNNQVLCITCNHVLSNSKDNHFMAVSSYQDITKFPIIPIKKVIECDYKKESLSASDEIAILVPQWDGKIPFDIDNIISIDDLCSNLLLDIPCECLCYGYPNEDSYEYNLSKCLRFENNVVLSRGYYETSIIADDEDIIDGGYSGGIIIPCDNPNYIIGIHEGRNGGHKGRMILRSTIRDIIMEVETNGQKL